MKIRTLAIIWVAASVAALTFAPPAAAKGVGDAINYVKARQGADGGFSEPDASPDGITTCWAMLAGTSTGQPVLEWQNGGAGPAAYLESQANALTKLPDIELYCLALAESGADPGDLGGKDLPAMIKSAAKEDGRIGASIHETCMGLTALASAGQEPPAGSVSWLLENQRADGGWGESDKVVVADTALAVEALVAQSQAEASVTDPAMKLLRQKMAADGGFPGESGKTDVQATATVMRAIYSAGQDPTSATWTFHGNNPVTFLDSMQAADGHYSYSKGTESEPTMTTSMAIPAVAGKHFPLTAPTVATGTGISDLGTTGAAMAPSSGPAARVQATRSRQATNISASGTASTNGGIGGLWLFLVMCSIYVVVLGIAALVAAKLYVPRAPGSVNAVQPPPWGGPQP
jgi:iron complex transport system substrate-binding protein